MKVVSLGAACLALATSAPAALIGYWNFDESSGTTAADTSGRVGPLNGTLSAVGTGGSLPLWTPGRFGNALDFNQGPVIGSAGSRVTVPNQADLLLPGAFTISFWWRPDYLPAASTFPGIMRIGTQGAGNVGWGFFRSSPNIPVHKRNNHQPTVYSAMTVGAWHHVALTHNGAGANIAYINGGMVNFTTNWANQTSTAVLEFGRMDQFDNAGLDDVGLFNETVSAAKVRSLYTVPNSLSLPYDLAKMRSLWAIFDAGPGASGVVDGTTWEHTAALPGSTTLGDAYISGNKWYVVLGAGAGLTATAVLLGDISPAGIGTLGTQAFTETPVIGASARFVFDLGSATTMGGGVNDLYDITGDLNLSGNTIVINPLAPLANGTYRLINYSGARSGSFNPVVVSNSRYTFTLDNHTATLTPDEDGGGARAGSGSVTASLSGNTLTLNGSFTGLSGNADNAHIHGPSGPFPATAGVLYGLNGITTLGGPSGTVSGTVALVEGTGGFTIAQQISQLNAGQWYINVHSTAFPGGEIRGSLLLPAGQINLTVSGSNGDVKWTSPSSGAWDLTSLNWQNTLTVATDRFFQGDSVRFDDSGAYQPTINLATGVFPSAMTVESSTLNYTFAGSPLGGLANGLLKDGTSTLTLNGANTFIGPVTVNEGLLRIGNAAALGSTNMGTTIASGATLDLNNQTPVNESVTVAGGGLGGIGAIVNNAGGTAADALRTVTLSGDAAFGGTGRWDFTGKINGGGYKLTKVGANEIWIAPVAGDTGLGDIEIQTGTLGFEGTAIPALGLPGSILTIQAAGTLGFWALNNAATPMQKTVVMNSGTWRNDNGNNHFNGGVTLNGNSIMTVGAGATLNQLGVIDGGGSLIKNNTGTLVLAGANTYSGATMVNAGTLGLLNSGSIAGSSGITLASGTTLNAATRTDGTLTLGSGQTLSGSGTVHGNVVSGTGTGIGPGFSAGTVTVTNALSLSDATLTYELSGATTEGAGVNDLINVGGALTLGGLTTVRVLPVGPLVVGTPYTLINYVGLLSGDMLNLNPVSDSRHTFVVDTLTTPGKVLLTAVGAAKSLEWVGGEAGSERLWDLNTTPNWLAENPERFYAGDTARFNDLALEFNVDLVGDLYAAGMIFENDVENYTVGGAGRLRGGSLTKANSGRVILANSSINDYPGQTFINAGTLQVGNGGTAGNLGPNSIVNNGTLVLHRSDNLTFANTMTGAGTLRKEGANLLTVGAPLAGFAGTIAVQGGTLRPTTTNGVGTTAGGTVISGGGTLDLNALNLDLEPITISGAGVGGTGAVVNASATGQNQALRNVTLGGDATIGGVGRWDIRNPGAGATLTGNGFALTKAGANQISLVNIGDTGLGDINVQQGIFSVELSSTMGLPAGTASVQSGATLMFWGSTVTHDKKFALNGGARLFKDNGVATMIGTGSLTGSNAVEVANNAGGSLTLAGIISGTGSLNKLGAATNFLAADNDYSGGTMISAGTLALGNGGASGSVQGNIVNNANLTVLRSDTPTLANNVTGTGSLNVRTPAGLILDGSGSINIGGTINVGQDSFGTLVVQPGAVATAGFLFLGNPANISGNTVQLGGDVTVTNHVKVGHWSTEISTYILGGGTLTLNGLPAGVVNQAAVAEQAGILYLGIDGIGIFTQTGGVATAHGVVLDGRGNTAAIGLTNETFNLEGGAFTLGPSGLKSGALDANATYQINLGGGTLGSSANWTSVLNMTLTGLNGDVALDTAANTVRLNGVLSGAGGLEKKGSGTLILQGVNTYAGTTLVTNGTLAGSGTLAGPVVVGPGGTLSPGLSIGTLTINGPLNLAGTTLMEIDKSGATRTSDLITGVTTLAYGGQLTVVATGDALVSGDTFNLFDATTYGGSFASSTLPTLGAGLFWDTSRLALDGTLHVISRPSFGPASLAGNSLTLSGTGGPPNDSYRVMTSDDVTDPLSAWTQVATGNFDGSGNFSSVITINLADPQRFYAILVP